MTGTGRSRRRRFSSVRARAALGATAVVAVALLAAGAAVLFALRANLIGQADAQAGAEAGAVGRQIAQGLPFDELNLPDAEDSPVQVVDADGRVAAVGDGLEAIDGTGSDVVEPQVTVGAAASGPDGAGDVSDEVAHTSGTATVDGDEEDYRFAAVEAENPAGQEFTVHAGAPLSPEQSALRTASTVMLVGFPVLLLVVGGVTWLVTRRALRPVEGIRAEMDAITASEDLGRRVPEPDSHDEIARLARTTNRTLAALEASTERQRRFVADASHELRSPIASLRTQLEVAAAHPSLLDLDGAVADTVRLQTLAADLLLLARLDAGERPSHARVDLAALVREEVARRGAGRVPVTVRTEEAEEAAVPGSRAQLARIVANLLDNAQRHAVGSVSVSVAVRRSDGSVVLEVTDDGPGVPEAERDRIFERFVRLDDARSRDDGGAGLGLAIARDIAVRHGGGLSVEPAPGGGARFVLRLPRAL